MIEIAQTEKLENEFLRNESQRHNMPNITVQYALYQVSILMIDIYTKLKPRRNPNIHRRMIETICNSPYVEIDPTAKAELNHKEAALCIRLFRIYTDFDDIRYRCDVPCVRFKRSFMLKMTRDLMFANKNQWDLNDLYTDVERESMIYDEYQHRTRIKLTEAVMMTL
jgi:hypothetical protein